MLQASLTCFSSELAYRLHGSLPGSVGCKHETLVRRQPSCYSIFVAMFQRQGSHVMSRGSKVCAYLPVTWSQTTPVQAQGLASSSRHECNAPVGSCTKPALKAINPSTSSLMGTITPLQHCISNTAIHPTTATTTHIVKQMLTTCSNLVLTPPLTPYILLLPHPSHLLPLLASPLLPVSRFLFLFLQTPQSCLIPSPLTPQL